MKIFKKLFVSFLIAILSFGGFAFAFGGGNGGPQGSMWKFTSNALLPALSTWEIGATGTRIAKLWVQDLDVAGTFTFGGVMGSALDMDGYDIILDTDGDTAILNDRDAGVADDEFDIQVGGAVDWTFSADTLTGVSGSDLTLANGTATATTFTDGTASLTGGSLTSVKLGTLTGNGLVKTSAGDGTLGTAIADTDYQQAVTWGDGLQYSAPTASVDYNTTNLKITSNEIDTIQGISTAATPQFTGASIGLNGGTSGVLTWIASDNDQVTATINTSDNLAFAGATGEYTFDNNIGATGTIYVNDAAGSAMLNEAATTTNPTLVPNRAENTTGIGWNTGEVHVSIGGASEYGFSATALSANDNDITLTGAIGRDTDNEINWGTDDQLNIVIGGVTSSIASISTGTGDNDKLVTQGYVDDNSGTGDVTKVGTPVNNQIGIWTGDGTLEGDTDVRWDDTTLTVVSNDFDFGNNGNAADTVIDFLSSGNDGSITYDQTDDEFDVGDAAITTTGNISATGITGALTGNADTVTNGVYTTDNMSVMSATTSAQLAGVISDETGSGLLCYATAPTFTTSIAVTDGGTIDADGIDLVTGNAFEINGTDVLDATTLGSTVVGSSLTSVGTLSTLTLGGTLTMADAGKTLYDVAPASDHTGTGDMASMTVDANSYGIGSCLHMDTDAHWIEADADAVTTMPCGALALETSTGTKTVLLRGVMRDDTWNFTVGAPVYVSTTAGTLTTTAPAGAGDQVQVVGIALTADVVLFNPDWTLVEISA